MKRLIFLLALTGQTLAADLNVSLGAIIHPSTSSPLIRVETRLALPSDWLSPLSENLSSYWQANGNLWHDAHYAIGTGIGAQYHFNDRWSFELGWGAIMLNDRYISSSHDMGSNFHFETTLGVQYRWDASNALRLNVYHWSNANLSDINPGCEIVQFAYQFNF